MTVSVIVPFRGDNGQRDRIWVWLHERLDAFWWSDEVVTSDSGHEPFNRAASINEGVAKCSGDVLVINDADTAAHMAWSVPIMGALKNGTWTIGHEPGAYCSLGAAATEMVLAMTPWVTLPAPSELPITEPERCTSDSGVVILPRQLFERAGGFDERYLGWGCEDVAFRIVMEHEVGPPARTGFTYHLHHPRGLEFKAPEWPANAILLERYREWAAGTPGFERP